MRRPAATAATWVNGHGYAGVAAQPPIDEQRKFWNDWNVRARSPTGLTQWTLLRGEAILGMLDSLALDQPRIMDLGCGTR